MSAEPTMRPASSIPPALPVLPPNVPRSSMTPAVQRNGWSCSDATSLAPTTTPAELIANAADRPAERPPRKVTVPFDCLIHGFLSWSDPELPTTCPASLIAVAFVIEPDRTPRFVMGPPIFQNQPCASSPVTTLFQPTMVPEVLIAAALLELA